MPVGTTYQPIAGVHSCLSGHDSELANAPHVADSIPHEYFILATSSQRFAIWTLCW